MEKFIVNKQSVRTVIPFNSNGTESNLFIKDHDILKFLKKEYLKEREYTVNRLEEIKHKDIAYPLYTLYSKSSFLGYAMHYYKRYSEFDSFITDGTISFEDKKKTAIKLCELFKFFEKNKYAYDDIHPRNIIYLDDDIKLLDLDGGLFYDKKNKLEYNSRIRVEQYRLAKMCLSMLYSIHPYYFEKYFKLHKKSLFDMLPENIIDIYKHTINADYSHFDCLEPISLITEDLIDETKLLLKKD